MKKKYVNIVTEAVYPKQWISSTSIGLSISLIFIYKELQSVELERFNVPLNYFHIYAYGLELIGGEVEPLTIILRADKWLQYLFADPPVFFSLTPDEAGWLWVIFSGIEEREHAPQKGRSHLCFKKRPVTTTPADSTETPAVESPTLEIEVEVAKVYSKQHI